MARSQPYGFACSGGLVDSANRFDLFKAPGVATTLRNFEVAVEGGYRRINGYSLFGGGSSARPNSSNQIYGLFVYADGVVAASGSNIYFSQDGTSWLQINKASVSASGDNHTAFTGRSALSLTSPAQYSFALYEGTSVYGDLVMTDASGSNKPFLFKMTGTDSDITNRTFFASQITISGSTTAKFCTIHGRRLVVAGDPSTPNTVYISAVNDIDDFTGGVSITLEDQIVGLKSFRNELFIFCENSIFKLQNINNSSTIAVIPVTKNVGCLSGHSIQEIAGDLIFLAPDGLRTVAGTARIGDVELGTVSSNIQNIVSDLAESVNIFTINSVVLREKSQYRLFYTNVGADDSTQRGIIGTLRPNGFEWSETRGLEVTAIGSGFDSSGIEQYYHGDTNGNVYLHDSGADFNGTNILARYTTPNYDYGDLGTLKTLHYLRVSMATEGIVEPDVQIKFDFNSSDVPQPTDLFDLGIVNPPSLFGEAVFNTNKFAGQNNPMIRVPLQGSGTSNNFTVISNDTKPSYTVNGLYVDFIPSGRR